jgi:hypothetical protein
MLHPFFCPVTSHSPYFETLSEVERRTEGKAHNSLEGLSNQPFSRKEEDIKFDALIVIPD